MLPLLVRRAGDGPLRLLAIGAHADDIEIGCGGTILKLIEQESLSEVWWVVLTGETKRAAEAGQSADALLGEIPGKRVILKDFRDGYFPYDGAEIKGFFEELKGEFSPDVILTHRPKRDARRPAGMACSVSRYAPRDIGEWRGPSS